MLNTDRYGDYWYFYEIQIQLLLMLNYFFLTRTLASRYIQIQPMLRLNVRDCISNPVTNAYSNTTNVKVKHHIHQT